MEGVWWPQNGPAVHGSQIPAFAHLDWYISRLMEKREHDLSQSGLQLDWSGILDGVQDLLVHPFNDGIDVRKMIADREGVSLDRVVPTHGTTDAIHLALAAALPSGSKKIAVEMPAYTPVCHSARLMGLETVEFERMIDGPGEWRLDRDRLSELIPTVDGVLFTRIMNPTGFAIRDDDLDWLVEATRMEGIPLLADEVYDDCMRRSEKYRPLHSLGKHCVSMNSLTKIYGLGALRFGWFIASEEVAKNGHRAFQTFNGMMAIPSARLAIAAWPHLERALDAIEERRKHNIPLLEAVLEKHGIEWEAPPFGVFGAFDIGCNAIDIVDGIAAEEGVLVVPGCMFHKDLSTWIRVAWSKEPKVFKDDVKALDRVLSRSGQSRDD